MRRVGLSELFMETIENGYSTTCLEILPPNPMLLRGARLDKLACLTHTANLVLQTSVDGARAQTHDAHRGWRVVRPHPRRPGRGTSAWITSSA